MGANGTLALVGCGGQAGRSFRQSRNLFLSDNRDTTTYRYTLQQHVTQRTCAIYQRLVLPVQHLPVLTCSSMYLRSVTRSNTSLYLQHNSNHATIQATTAQHVGDAFKNKD